MSEARDKFVEPSMVHSLQGVAGDGYFSYNGAQAFLGKLADAIEALIDERIASAIANEPHNEGCALITNPERGECDCREAQPPAGGQPVLPGVQLNWRDEPAGGQRRCDTPYYCRGCGASAHPGGTGPDCESTIKDRQVDPQPSAEPSLKAVGGNNWPEVTPEMIAAHKASAQVEGTKCSHETLRNVGLADDVCLYECVECGTVFADLGAPKDEPSAEAEPPTPPSAGPIADAIEDDFSALIADCVDDYWITVPEHKQRIREFSERLHSLNATAPAEGGRSDTERIAVLESFGPDGISAGDYGAWRLTTEDGSRWWEDDDLDRVIDAVIAARAAEGKS